MEVPINGVSYQQYLHLQWALGGIYVSFDTMALAGITRSSIQYKLSISSGPNGFSAPKTREGVAIRVCRLPFGTSY